MWTPKKVPLILQNIYCLGGEMLGLARSFKLPRLVPGLCSHGLGFRVEGLDWGHAALILDTKV